VRKAQSGIKSKRKLRLPVSKVIHDLYCLFTRTTIDIGPSSSHATVWVTVLGPVDFPSSVLIGKVGAIRAECANGSPFCWFE
jgi:hypothetical protein